MDVGTILLILLGILFAIPIWQYQAFVNNWRFRPGTIFKWMASVLQAMWSGFGKLWAYISSFYTWIDFKAFWEAQKETSDGFIECLKSYESFKVAYNVVADLYDSPQLIKYGSWTLGCLMILLIWWKLDSLISFGTIHLLPLWNRMTVFIGMHIGLMYQKIEN